jgi:hypothetical protein
VNGDRAVSIDVPAHEIDAGPGQSGSLGIVEPLVGSAPGVHLPLTATVKKTFEIARDTGNHLVVQLKEDDSLK